MAIDFPSNPAINDEFTSASGITYIWNGQGWVVKAPAAEFASFEAMAYQGLQVNGGMEISEQYGAAGINVTGAYPVDQWSMHKTGTAVVTGAQIVAAATSVLPFLLAMTVQTAQVTMGGGDFAIFMQGIEGNRLSRLRWGTAQAQAITIGFWTAHHRTGIYSVAVRNGANTRSYVTTYTQTVADAYEYKTITIPGDLAGTWTRDSLAGMTVVFVAAAGATLTAPAADVWNGVNYLAAPGQVNGVAATSDVFRITGVSILPGSKTSTAARSPYLMRPYDQELILCKRYWQRMVSVFIPTNAVGQTVVFPIPMRATPVVTGGGAGFTGTTSNTNATWYQTTAGYQTLDLNARV